MVYITSITVLVGKLGGSLFFFAVMLVDKRWLSRHHIYYSGFQKKSLIAREYRAQQVIFNRQDSALEDESTMSISCIIILRHAIFESKAAMTHPIPLGKVKLIILITVTAANDPKQMRAWGVWFRITRLISDKMTWYRCKLPLGNSWTPEGR